MNYSADKLLAPKYFKPRLSDDNQDVNWKAVAYLLAAILSGNSNSPLKASVATDNWIDWAITNTNPTTRRG